MHIGFCLAIPSIYKILIKRGFKTNTSEGIRSGPFQRTVVDYEVINKNNEEQPGVNNQLVDQMKEAMSNSNSKSKY